MDVDKDSCLYGYYGGKFFCFFNKDMDFIIVERYLKVQKQKYLDIVMKGSKEKGMILGDDKMLEKVCQYFMDKWGVQYF